MKNLMFRSMRLALVAYLIACFLSVSALAEDKAPALTVVVAPVIAQSLQTNIVATGTVAAWRDMPISSEATGLAITEIAVDEGDLVEKGQILARLDDRILLAQVAQQKAAIEELDATLATAQSDVRRAQAVGAGVISAQTAEQRETLVKTTTAKLAAARASLDEIDARLAQTQILAPASGLVASRSVVLGQVVQTGTEMFRLIRDRRLEVNALVSETDLLNIRAGQSARVFDPNGQPQAGTVRIVAPIVDAKTRLGTVRVALQPDTKLKPGMFARVEIMSGAKVALAVPMKSLVWHQSQAGVFKVSNAGVAALTAVTIGRRTSDSVEITSGLDAGDHVVVDGAGLLQDGDTVRVDVASAQSKAAP